MADGCVFEIPSLESLRTKARQDIDRMQAAESGPIKPVDAAIARARWQSAAYFSQSPRVAPPGAQLYHLFQIDVCRPVRAHLVDFCL